VAETVASMDAGVEPPWMGSRRVSATATGPLSIANPTHELN